MSGAIMHVLGAVYISGCAISWYVILFAPSWTEEFNYYFGPVYAIGSFAAAVRSLLERDWFGTALFSVYSLIGAWWWWNDHNHRRRRKKLIDRAAGVVRDIGGRLKVVQPVKG